jgi:hypothetical protein
VAYYHHRHRRVSEINNLHLGLADGETVHYVLNSILGSKHLNQYFLQNRLTFKFLFLFSIDFSETVGALLKKFLSESRQYHLYEQVSESPYKPSEEICKKLSTPVAFQIGGI